MLEKGYLKELDGKYDLKGAMFCSGLFKRPCWNVTRIEDERIGKAQRIDDLIENPTPRGRILRQVGGEETDFPCFAINR